METKLRGSITRVVGCDGYGFIRGQDGIDYHFLFSNVEPKETRLRRFQIVEFDVLRSTIQGKKDSAYHVKVL